MGIVRRGTASRESATVNSAQRITTLIKLSCLCVLFLTTHNSFAHHSRASVDLKSKVEVVGEVKKLVWRNPHIFIHVVGADKAGNRGTWVLEGHSVSGMLNHGWMKDSIQIGSKVTAVFSPNRNPSKKSGLIDHFTREDGKRFYPFKTAPPSRAGGIKPKPRKPIHPSNDFSGNWTYVRSLMSVLVSSAPDFDNYPLNAEGKVAVKSYDPLDDPEFNCESRGIPNLPLYVYGYRWTRHPDRIEIEKEQAITDAENRTIYLDNKLAKAQKSSPVGISTGRFEDNGSLLVVETNNFVPTTWGIAEGIDSSAEKRVVERYRLTNQGMRMQISISVEDRVYLAAPLLLYGVYDKRADREFFHSPCDPDVAKEHLKYE
jgi:hypothetical protein